MSSPKGTVHIGRLASCQDQGSAPCESSSADLVLQLVIFSSLACAAVLNAPSAWSGARLAAHTVTLLNATPFPF